MSRTVKADGLKLRQVGQRRSQGTGTVGFELGVWVGVCMHE